MKASELKRFAVLGDLSEEERDDVLAQLEPRLLACGETLFHEGDPSDALVLLEAGALRLTSRRSGEQAAIGPGMALGALALFAVGRREVTAVATEASSVLLLPRRAYRRLVMDCPGAACRIAESVLAELAGLMRVALDPGVTGRLDRRRRGH